MKIAELWRTPASLLSLQNSVGNIIVRGNYPIAKKVRDELDYLLRSILL